MQILPENAYRCDAERNFEVGFCLRVESQGNRMLAWQVCIRVVLLDMFTSNRR